MRPSPSHKTQKEKEGRAWDIRERKRGRVTGAIRTFGRSKKGGALGADGVKLIRGQCLKGRGEEGEPGVIYRLSSRAMERRGDGRVLCRNSFRKFAKIGM